MNKILFVSVGEQEVPILKTFSSISGYETIYLISSNKTKNVAQEIKKKISQIYEKVEIELVDAYDLHEILSKILKLSNGKVVEFNLTGGTKVMTLAFYIAAILLESKCIYYSLEDRLIEIPVISRSWFNRNLNGKKIHILNYLLKKNYAVKELSEILKLSPQTVEGHLKTLEYLNFIRREKVGKNTCISITEIGKLYVEIAEILNR
ncbi:MAG: ArsR family transcriptional regulator [Candidatus Woesearchaeota archaeon]